MSEPEAFLFWKNMIHLWGKYYGVCRDKIQQEAHNVTDSQRIYDRP